MPSGTQQSQNHSAVGSHDGNYPSMKILCPQNSWPLRILGHCWSTRTLASDLGILHLQGLPWHFSCIVSIWILKPQDWHFFLDHLQTGVASGVPAFCKRATKCAPWRCTGMARHDHPSRATGNKVTPILRLPWAMPSDTWERCTPPPYLHGRRLLKPGECQDGTARCLASENAARKTVPFRKNSHKLNENNIYRLNTNWIHKQKTYNIYRLKSKEFCRTSPSPSAPAALSRNSSRQWARRAQRGTAAPVAFGVPLHPRRIQ